MAVQLSLCRTLLETTKTDFVVMRLILRYQGVEELVKRGADINERSNDGMTPLGIAAFWGYAEIAEFLLNSG